MSLNPETFAFCFAARLFGFLPYTWKVRNHNDERYLVFTKSFPWLVWSTFMVGVIFVLMILDLYWAVAEPRGQFLGYQALILSQMLFDITSAITVVILHFLFWLKGDLFSYLVFNLTQKMKSKMIQVETRVAKMSLVFDVFSQFVWLPFFFGVTIYVQQEEKLNTCSVIASGIKCACLVAFMNYIRLIHVTTQNFVKNELKATFQSFRNFSDTHHEGYPDHGVLSKLKIEMPFERVEKQVTTKMIASLPPRSRVNNLVDESHSQITDLDLDKINYAEVKDRVLSLFRHLRASSRYLDLPIAVAMLCLLIWLLVSLFYVALWTKLVPLTRFYSSCLFVAAVVPAIALLDSTHAFNGELKSTKWILSSLLHHSSCQHLKEKSTSFLEAYRFTVTVLLIGYPVPLYVTRHRYIYIGSKLEALRAVLEDCPQEEVFGMFELSRARIIEISGFLATYIIILLQYSLGEDTTGTAGNSTAK